MVTKVFGTLTSIRPQIYFSYPAAMKVYIETEGAMAWFSQMQTLGRIKFIESMRDYHRDVILVDEIATAMYVNQLTEDLTAYGSFLLN
jgi:hypothetical protein